MTDDTSDTSGDENAGFDAPTREESRFNDCIENIIYLFQHVAHSPETASALSEAMYSLDLQMWRQNAYRPSMAQRDRLLVASAEAYAAAMRRLPDKVPRTSIVTGMTVLPALICYWAADDEYRATRTPGFLANMTAFARMLRNELHNLCLAEEISERARGHTLSHWPTPSAQAHGSNSKH